MFKNYQKTFLKLFSTRNLHLKQKDLRTTIPTKNLINAKKSVSEIKLPTKNEIIFDEKLQLNYKKIKLNDYKLLNGIFMPKKKSERKIIIEGKTLILEALKNHLELKTIIFSNKSVLEEINLKQFKQSKSYEILKIPKENLHQWSSVIQSSGLIGIFERSEIFQPSKMATTTTAYLQPITIICDEIREPNNLGSLIRVCSAIPCRKVILMKGCCDPWSTKALRSGCGGQFYIDIIENFQWKNIDTILPELYSIFIAENNLKKLQTNHLNTILQYSDINKNISNSENFLIIGGETNGISENAFRFFNEAKTKQKNIVNIPLSINIDSLNVVSALTVILFEMRKELLFRQQQDRNFVDE